MRESQAVRRNPEKTGQGRRRRSRKRSRRRHSRSPVLWMITGAAVFCFASALFCILAFGKAENMRREIGERKQAASQAGILAEALKSGDDSLWTDTLPDRDIWEILFLTEGEKAAKEGKNQRSTSENQVQCVYFDKDWNLVEPDSNWEYIGVLKTEEQDVEEEQERGVMRYKTIWIFKYSGGREKGKCLFSLELESYQKP